MIFEHKMGNYIIQLLYLKAITFKPLKATYSIKYISIGFIMFLKWDLFIYLFIYQYLSHQIVIININEQKTFWCNKILVWSGHPSAIAKK